MKIENGKNKEKQIEEEKGGRKRGWKSELEKENRRRKCKGDKKLKK